MAYKGVIPKQPYPELLAKLAAAIPLLPSTPMNDKTFALSLHDGHIKYGGWSDKQALWAQKMVDKVPTVVATDEHGDDHIVVLDPTPVTMGVDFGTLPDEVVHAIVPGEMTPIYTLFETGAKHLKSPSIQLVNPLWASKPIVLKKSKKLPQINVVSTGGYGANKYYGKITDTGEYVPKYGLSEEVVAAVTTALKGFAADPAGVAAQYGKLHGKCCFCNKGLTDEKSTSVGYGPICAQHYGLPWGTTIALGIDYGKGDDSVNVVVLQGQQAGKTFFKLPAGDLYKDMKTAAEAAKVSSGEKVLPVLSSLEYERMKQRVEILF